jgi:hypothetical protein
MRDGQRHSATIDPRRCATASVTAQQLIRVDARRPASQRNNRSASMRDGQRHSAEVRLYNGVNALRNVARACIAARNGMERQMASFAVHVPLPLSRTQRGTVAATSWYTACFILLVLFHSGSPKTARAVFNKWQACGVVAVRRLGPATMTTASPVEMSATRTLHTQLPRHCLLQLSWHSHSVTKSCFPSFTKKITRRRYWT